MSRPRVPEQAKGALRLFIGLAVATLMVLAVQYAGAKSIRDANFRLCKAGTIERWASAQADHAHAARERILADADPNPRTARAHRRSAIADDRARRVKLRRTASTPAGRRAYCARTWPEPPVVPLG